jgi:hypothetical protein
MQAGSNAGIGLRPYQSGAGLVSGVTTLIVITTVASIVEIVLCATAQTESIKTVFGLFSLAYLAILITSGVFFLRWTYRSYANLEAFGAQGLRTTPGFAVGYFFIPVLNIYQPYNIFREMWQGSNLELTSTAALDRKAIKTPPMLATWWLLWIFAGVLNNLTARSSEGVQVALTFAVAYALVIAFDAYLAVTVVRRLTAMQDAKWAALTGDSSGSERAA